jgi:hypothetical protein
MVLKNIGLAIANVIKLKEMVFIRFGNLTIISLGRKDHDFCVRRPLSSSDDFPAAGLLFRLFPAFHETEFGNFSSSQQERCNAFKY